MPDHFEARLRPAIQEATPGPWEENGLFWGADIHEADASTEDNAAWVTFKTPRCVEDRHLFIELVNRASEIAALVEAARHARQFLPTYPERSPGWLAWLAVDRALAALDGAGGEG